MGQISLFLSSTQALLQEQTPCRSTPGPCRGKPRFGLLIGRVVHPLHAHLISPPCETPAQPQAEESTLKTLRNTEFRCRGAEHGWRLHGIDGMLLRTGVQRSRQVLAGRLASDNRGLLKNREFDPSMWNGSLNVVYFISDQHLQAAVTYSAVPIANQFRLQTSGCDVGGSSAAPTSLTARFTWVHTNGG